MICRGRATGWRVYGGRLQDPIDQIVEIRSVAGLARIGEHCTSVGERSHAHLEQPLIPGLREMNQLAGIGDYVEPELCGIAGAVMTKRRKKMSSFEEPSLSVPTPAVHATMKLLSLSAVTFGAYAPSVS
jgi:hypothetical protein